MVVANMFNLKINVLHSQVVSKVFNTITLNLNSLLTLDRKLATRGPYPKHLNHCYHLAIQKKNAKFIDFCQQWLHRLRNFLKSLLLN
jgi:hypothetical protein